MKQAFRIFIIFIVIGLLSFSDKVSTIVSYTANPHKQDIKLYWKNNKGEIFKSIQNLKNFTESKKQTLVFAMNAGMYKKDNSPQGLFIQDKKTITPLDTISGTGNFYLMPNGVFYINENKIASICETKDFVNKGNILYGTQSGPMLLIDGNIHSAFKQGSSNLNIRNGVGILPNGDILFAMSTVEINFYDFALYFKNLGCKSALYLDGFVSRMYCPEKNQKQLDGNFGVMIGVTQEIKN